MQQRLFVDQSARLLPRMANQHRLFVDRNARLLHRVAMGVKVPFAIARFCCMTTDFFDFCFTFYIMCLSGYAKYPLTPLDCIRIKEFTHEGNVI